MAAKLFTLVCAGIAVSLPMLGNSPPERIPAQEAVAFEQPRQVTPERQPVGPAPQWIRPGGVYPPINLPVSFRIQFTTDTGSNVDVVAKYAGTQPAPPATLIIWTAPSVAYSTSLGSFSDPVELIFVAEGTGWYYLHLGGGDKNRSFGANSFISGFDFANPGRMGFGSFGFPPFSGAPPQYLNIIVN